MESFTFELLIRNMRAKLIAIALFYAVILLSCKKDEFTTRPQLEFISTSLTTWSPGENITFTLKFTDKEGDIFGFVDPILDTALYVQKLVRNCAESSTASYYELPDAPEVDFSEGELLIRYSYSPASDYPLVKDPVCDGKNDSCIFRFVLRDRAGNVSDTISSPEIVLIER